METGQRQPASQAPSQQVFLRQSSGLVKSAGALNVFIFNVGIVSIGIGIAADQLYGPAYYPGGSLPWAVIIAALLMVPVGLTFYFLTVTYPRSGGFYVYMTRSTPPAFGFALSVLENVVFLFYGGVVASYVTTQGLAPLLAILGYQTGSSTLTSWSTTIAGPWGIFIVGAVALVGGGLLAISGMQRYFVVQRILVGLAIVGTLVAVGVLLVGSHQTFVTNLDAFMGKSGSYNAVIDAARKAGWTSAPVTFGATIGLIVWPLFVLIGSAQSIGIGGEIKRVGRSQIVGILAALGVSALLLVVVQLLSDNVFGSDFEGAVAFNFLGGVTPAPAIIPYFSMLGSLVASNAVLTIFVAGAMILWPLAWVPLQIVYTDRTMLAWALDRMAPDQLAYVHPRYNTPVVAIAVCVVLMLAFLALFVFTPYVTTLNLLEGLGFVWGCGMVAAAVMPFTKPAEWAKSPASAYKLGGIPVITITGFAGAAFFAYFIYLLWNDSIAAGHTPASIAVMVGAFVLGLVAYWAVKYWRAQRGIDVSKAFAQIPVE